MQEIEIVQLIAPFADVITIKLVCDRATKKCKGYGFVEVSTEEQANAAIEGLSGTPMGDRVLTLNIVPEQGNAPVKPVRNYTRAPQQRPNPNYNKRPRRPRV